jgi:thiol-disulfide isomerase/thioredoxin
VRGVRAAAALLAAAGLLLTACGGNGGAAAPPGGSAAPEVTVPPAVGGHPPDRDPFLDLALEDPQGRAIPLAGHGGKVRVFDVWATWCAPCREIIPHLNGLHERYRERGVVVIGIAVDSEPADVIAFQNEVPMRYPSGMFTPEVEALLGAPRGVPTTYLIDRSGVVRRTFLGILDMEELEDEIRALL